MYINLDLLYVCYKYMHSFQYCHPCLIYCKFTNRGIQITTGNKILFFDDFKKDYSIYVSNPLNLVVRLQVTPTWYFNRIPISFNKEFEMPKYGADFLNGKIIKINVS